MPTDRGQRVDPGLRRGRLYYRWRKEHGGLKTEQARRTKDLEKENIRLRRAISDLTLDKLILQDESISDPFGGWIVARMRGETEPRTASAVHRLYERYAETLAGLHVVAFACLMMKQAATLAAGS